MKIAKGKPNGKYCLSIVIPILLLFKMPTITLSDILSGNAEVIIGTTFLYGLIRNILGAIFVIWVVKDGEGGIKGIIL